MYTVTVRLILSIDSWNALAIVGIAGKYTLAVKGLVIKIGQEMKLYSKNNSSPEHSSQCGYS